MPIYIAAAEAANRSRLSDALHCVVMYLSSIINASRIEEDTALMCLKHISYGLYID